MARIAALFLGALILGSGLLRAFAAQAVPLPVPAPLPKVGMPPTAIETPNPVTPPKPLGKSGESGNLDINQQILVDKVSVYLSNIRTLIGNFVQVGPDGSKTKGEFYLQKPGRVRFEYNDPSPIELVADGQSVVVRDRKLATQDLYPLGQTPLRFLLADRVDLMKDTNVVGVYADDVFITVVMEEKTLGGIHRVMLMFGAQDMTLKQWTITDPQGFDTTVAVYNLDTNKKPDPGLFKINYERVLQ